MLDTILDLRLKEHFYDNRGWEHQTALERKFPRIVNELCRRWRARDVDEYVDNLLIDNRGNRMGFPADVLDELIFIAGIRWHLQHALPDRMNEPHAEPFSFQAWDDTPSNSTQGRGWVL